MHQIANNIQCGLNGALYFVSMDADGGTSENSTNKAGAQYGTGYCDSQCPRDLKFIDGEVSRRCPIYPCSGASILIETTCRPTSKVGQPRATTRMLVLETTAHAARKWLVLNTSHLFARLTYSILFTRDAESEFTGRLGGQLHLGGFHTPPLQFPSPGEVRGRQLRRHLLGHCQPVQERV